MPFLRALAYAGPIQCLYVSTLRELMVIVPCDTLRVLYVFHIFYPFPQTPLYSTGFSSCQDVVLQKSPQGAVVARKLGS